ncbi:hypothetical protein [Rhizobium sp.]
METTSSTSSNIPLARICAGAVALAAVAVILFFAVTGWLAHGSTILYTLAQEGIAWCL